MPTNPVLLASGELPLLGERLDVDAVREQLVTDPYRNRPYSPASVRFLVEGARHERDSWTHAFLVVASHPSVHLRDVLGLRHRLTTSDLRAAAEQRLAELEMPLGAHRTPERSRALHDLTVTTCDCPVDTMRLYLYVRSTTGNAVPPIADLPILAGTARMELAA